MAVREGKHVIAFLDQMRDARATRRKLIDLVKGNRELVKKYLDTLSDEQKADPEMSDIYNTLEKIVNENLK